MYESESFKSNRRGGNGVQIFSFKTKVGAKKKENLLNANLNFPLVVKKNNTKMNRILNMICFWMRHSKHLIFI